MSEVDRLYGFIGAEELHDSPQEALDDWLADWTDEPPTSSLPVLIEEWDTYPPSEHLPEAGRLLEWIADYAADQEVTEGFTDQLVVTCDTPQVIACAQLLLDTIAGRVTYRMARTMLGTLIATRTASGEWLIDGEPAWVVTPQGEAS